MALTAASRERIAQLLRLHEGYRLFPYEDTVGKLTIGIGRNLDEVGLSPDEVELLFTNDLKRVERELGTQDWAQGHGQVRELVLTDMLFNLGLTKLLGFKRMIAALRARDYAGTAREMLDSKWARQVGPRALRLARMMESGRWL